MFSAAAEVRWGGVCFTCYTSPNTKERVTSREKIIMHKFEKPKKQQMSMIAF